MLLFYCTSLDRLPRLRACGVRDALLWRTLGDARLLASEAIVVADGTGLGETTDEGGPSLRARKVPAAAFVNLSPYLPPASVRAAGGVVLRSGVWPLQVLLIHRKGYWDLPKGKCVPGEVLRECAEREVQEETGIGELRTFGCLGATRHGYAQGGEYHIKHTYWYHMQSPAIAFTPQADEGITGVRWMRWEEAVCMLGYESLQRLLRGAADALGSTETG